MDGNNAQGEDEMVVDVKSLSPSESFDMPPLKSTQSANKQNTRTRLKRSKSEQDSQSGSNDEGDAHLKRSRTQTTKSEFANRA